MKDQGSVTDQDKLTPEQIEQYRHRLEVLNQISINYDAAPVQAQVGEDGKIKKVVVYEKRDK